MLCGFPPFYDENNQKLFQSIMNCEYEFPSPYWDKVSEAAKDLIRKILVQDPSKRLTAEEMFEHPWI
jgi:serine/threonine protein kinase